MKSVISEWKSWCPISLQRGLATLNLLLWKIIRTSCFNNSNSSHKCIIFSQKLLFWFAKCLVPPLEKNIFSINLLFKRIKDQNTVLCLLLTIIALTSLSPWSVYPTPFAYFGSQTFVGFVGLEHSHLYHQCLSRELCFRPWYRHTSPSVKRLHPYCKEELTAAKLCPFI